ncbi:hypothetical protein BHE74_00043774 [Ensete ventricosum]|nr:hypothetical protein BHE74_00043774 [Ensete ventricosum]
MTMWYQSGTSTRRDTCHTNVGDLVGLCEGQPARATVWEKNGHRDVGKGVAQRSGHPGLAFRGMANPLRERHHEDKQAKKNA